MNAKKAKQKGYTNKGKLYGVPIYFTNDAQMNVVGINWLNNLLLEFFVWFDINFTDNDGFRIEDEGEL